LNQAIIKSEKTLSEIIAKLAEDCRIYSFGGKVVYLQYMGSMKQNYYTNTFHSVHYVSGFNDVYISKINPNSRLDYPQSHEFTKRFEKIHQTMETLESKRAELISKLEGALSTYTTTDNLLKDWPDMKPLIPLPVEKSVKHLPMVQLIGLHVK